jgi:hypothetical protein
VETAYRLLEGVAGVLEGLRAARQHLTHAGLFDEARLS